MSISIVRVDAERTNDIKSENDVEVDQYEDISILRC